MNRSELVEQVKVKAHLASKKEAERAIDALFETLKEVLVAGDKIQLIGFGTFEVKERAARRGRNPRTGEEIEIPASKYPSFKPGKTFKDEVNGGESPDED